MRTGCFGAENLLIVRVGADWRARVLVCAIGGLLTSGAGAVVGCGSPSRTALQATSNGEQVFARACAKCHREDGSGGLPMAAGGPRPIDLRQADWQASRSDEEITTAIRDGRGAMPPFDDVLTPAEVAELARYIRRMAERPPQ